jgi:hypothetical protein
MDCSDGDKRVLSQRVRARVSVSADMAYAGGGQVGERRAGR